MRHFFLFLISLLFGLSSKSQELCDDLLQVPYYIIGSISDTIVTGDTISLPNSYGTITVNEYESIYVPFSFWSNAAPLNWGISCDCLYEVTPNTPITELSIYHFIDGEQFPYSNIPSVIINGDSSSSNLYNHSLSDFPMTVGGISISIDTNVVFDSLPNAAAYKQIFQGNINTVRLQGSPDGSMYKICYAGDYLNQTEIDNIDNISIYPNPTSDMINIDVESEALYNLYSILGKEVLKSGNFKQGKNKMDLSDLETGIYILEITTNKGISTSKKIIKQ